MLLFLLACGFGCSLRAPTPQGGTADPGTPARGTAPYTVKGKTYYPLLSANGFREEGIASWYGPGFQGKTTANGERYNMYGMTAAHKLLPFGTNVKVTNKNNGRSIVVRINDRGPFVANRVIDLTKSGAEKIDMLATGTAPVILETVGSVAGLSEGRLTGRFYVQVGAFANRSNADKLLGTLNARGLAGRTYYAEQVGFWRVQAGPYPELRDAENAESRLQSEFSGCFTVAE